LLIRLKAASGIMLTILLISMITLAFNTHPAEAESETWTIKYDGNVLPENADPPWRLTTPTIYQGDRWTDGDILALYTTDVSSKRELQYQQDNIVDRSTGITIEARVKIGYISLDGTIPDTQIALCDSHAFFGLVFLEDRVHEVDRPDNYYLVNTTERFHVYRVTSVNGTTKVYVDGIYRLTITGFAYSYNYALFGDMRMDPGGMNGLSYWDYVKIDITGAKPPLPPTPVGGKATPINKIAVKPMNSLESLAPYIGLTILLALAVVTVVYVKKRKRDTEIIS